MSEPLVALPALIAQRARECPGRPFLQHVGGESLTFGDVQARALVWARRLRGLGVKDGDRVVVMLPASFEAVTVWLGIGWLKAVEVPVHTEFRGRMLQYAISTVAPVAMVVHASFRDRVEEVEDQLPSGLQLALVGEPERSLQAEDAEREGSGELQLAPPQPHELSGILYTSGTTGPSKGVMITWAHAQAMSEGCVPLEPLGSDDAWYSPYPLFHASGKIPVYSMALLGGRVVIRERFDGTAFWGDIEHFRCTITMMIGATAGYIAARRVAEKVTDSPLRFVLVSPPPADPPAFEREFGVRICSTFNMTEISAPISSEWRPMRNRTCGRVRAGYECRIVNELDEELPDGTPGELIVRSEAPWRLTLGYWNMPEKTVEAWRNGWFHTGDVCVKTSDGEFFFVDRLKDAIRRRGENISSMEVEAVVIEYEDVQECAAFGVPADDGEEEVKIAVVAADPDSFDPARLIEFLAPRLPRFMVPRYVEVVESLPRTATEKVQKDALRAAGVTASTWDRRAAGVEVAR